MMRRLLNLAIFFTVLGIVGLALLKAGVLPPPSQWAKPAPSQPPETEVRSDLYLSVSDRPERYLLGAIERLLEADRGDAGRIVRYPYDPDTVWLKLNAGELDLVVTSLNEAVRGLSLVPGGRLLFFSGLSQGYDQVAVLAENEGEQPRRLGFQQGSSQHLFAKLAFPEAEMIPGRDQRELEVWLLERLLDAAVVESDKLGNEEAGNTVTLLSTSKDRPLPTVVVLSERMVGERERQSARWETLKAALDSWTQLVEYLEEQPELLRATLRRESSQDGVDVDRLLLDYCFLAPASGRSQLLEAHRTGLLRQAFDLLVVAWVENLVHPEWDMIVELPEDLKTYFPEASTDSPVLPEAEVEAPSEPQGEEEEVEENVSTHRVEVPYSLRQAPNEPRTTTKVRTDGQRYPVAVGDSHLAVAKGDGLGLYSFDGRPSGAWVADGVLTTPPVASSGGFRFGVTEALVAIDEAGQEQWRHSIEESSPSTALLVAGDSLVFGTGGTEPTLQSIRSSDGSSQWQTRLDAELASTPVLTGGLAPAVVFADSGGNLRCHRLADGEQLWERPLPSTSFLPLAASADRVALVWPEGRVAVYSSADGEPISSTDLGASLATGATLTAEAVLVPSKDTYLYFLESGNQGRVKQRIRLGAALSQPCQVLGTVGVIADEAGVLHGVDLVQESLLWSKTLSEQGLVGPSFGPTVWVAMDRQGQLFLNSPGTE